VLAAGAIAAALALSGCSGGDSETGSKNVNSATTSASAAEGSDSSEGSGKSAVEAGVDVNNLPSAIATQTIPGDREVGVDTVKVDLVRLERQGKVVKAVFALTPKMVKPGGSVNMHDGMNGVSPNVRLVDTVNLKLYKTIELADSNGDRLETNTIGSGNFVDGKPFFVWGVVAAPPEDVTKVDVLVFGSLGAPLKDVPLS